MALDLLTNVTIREGLNELGGIAYSMRDNLIARLKTPILEDGVDLWKTYIDSKDVNFYGSNGNDGRSRFKMDHEFDLTKIINANLSNGAVPSNSKDYSASTATEFIILDDNHAVRADKYATIVGKLDQDDYSIADLQDGIFKINANLSSGQVIKYDKSKKVEDLTWDDIEYVHDGWIEHAVGKNNASKDEYLETAKLLANYVLEAEKRDCFDGMGFYVNTGEDFVVRPWFIYNSDLDSDAFGRISFNFNGHFLRVFDKVGEADTQKINYDTALKVILDSANPIKNDTDFAGLMNKLNQYSQAKAQNQQ